MKCSISACPKEAKFLCLCNNFTFCPKHIGYHMNNPGNHFSEPLSENLNSKNQTLLNQEILKRMNQIESSKIQIVSVTSNLIKSLEFYSKLAIKKLDDLSLFYANLLKLQIYTKTLKKEIETIINTSLKFKTVSFDIDITLKEVYNSDLFSLINLNQED